MELRNVLNFDFSDEISRVLRYLMYLFCVEIQNRLMFSAAEVWFFRCFLLLCLCISGYIPAATAEDVYIAVEAARKALSRNGGKDWASATGAHRAKYLRAIAAKVLEFLSDWDISLIVVKPLSDLSLIYENLLQTWVSLTSYSSYRCFNLNVYQSNYVVHQYYGWLWLNCVILDVGFLPYLVTVDYGKEIGACKTWSGWLWETIGRSSLGHSMLLMLVADIFWFSSLLHKLIFYLSPRMMLLDALNTMLTLLRDWIKSKRFLFLYPWIHLNVMFWGNLLGLLVWSHHGRCSCFISLNLLYMVFLVDAHSK